MIYPNNPLPRRKARGKNKNKSKNQKKFIEKQEKTEQTQQSSPQQFEQKQALTLINPINNQQKKIQVDVVTKPIIVKQEIQEETKPLFNFSFPNPFNSNYQIDLTNKNLFPSTNLLTGLSNGLGLTDNFLNNPDLLQKNQSYGTLNQFPQISQSAFKSCQFIQLGYNQSKNKRSLLNLNSNSSLMNLLSSQIAL